MLHQHQEMCGDTILVFVVATIVFVIYHAICKGYCFEPNSIIPDELGVFFLFFGAGFAVYAFEKATIASDKMEKKLTVIHEYQVFIQELHQQSLAKNIKVEMLGKTIFYPEPVDPESTSSGVFDEEEVLSSHKFEELRKLIAEIRKNQPQGISRYQIKGFK